MKANFSLAFLAGGLTAGFAQVSPTASTPTTTPASTAEVVVLSPFVIDGSANRGYDSNNTLSGTRLNTPTKYLGSASTEITAALMADLALFNMQELVDFTPNASSYFGGGITSDTSGTGALFGVNYNVRGLAVSTVSRDFINYRVPDDGYNIEQFSFTRGPNSVLFGVGNPAGVVNSISKRARMNNRYQAIAGADTNGSRRVSVDLNQQIVPKIAAVRLAALSENRMTDRRPSDRKSDRLYGTVTINPTATTTVRLSGEQGDLDSLAVRPWVADNGTVAWVAAGRQEIPANLRNGGTSYASFPVQPSGTPTRAVNIAQLNAAGFEAQFTTPQPVYVSNSLGSSPLPLLNVNGLVFTGRAIMPNGDRAQSWINPPIPYETNVLGYGNRLVQHSGNGSVNVEQRIGQHLFIEAMYNRQRTINYNNFSSNNDTNIYIDKNPTLLTWANTIITNPNYNRYFTYSTAGSSYLSSYIDQTSRVTASYELDLERGRPGWLAKLMGHHNFAVLRERTSADYTQTYAVLANVTPDLKTPLVSPLAATQLLSANNRPAFINYITPGERGTYASPDHVFDFNFPHFIFSGTPKPTAADPSGVNPAYFVSTSLRSLQHINTKMIVAQNFFWNNRVVTTFGARKDASELWLLATLPDPANPNYTIDAGKRNVKGGTKIERSGNTYTQGAVVAITRWLGVFYNRSSNFVPPSGLRLDLFGQPLPNGEGIGQDYGFKLDLFGGKVVANINRYTTDYKGVPGSIFRGGSTNLNTPLQAIITAMNNSDIGGPGGPTWNGAFPWPSGNQSYSSLNDVVSRGYEISLSSNLTKDWRVTANLSHQVSAASNFGATEARWFEEIARGYFKAHPEYLGLRTGAGGPQNNNETIAERLQDMSNILTLAQSLNGKADARQAQYSANFTTGYDFSGERLKGLGIGATYQWRQKMILGYPFLKGYTTIFDTTKPYYSDPTHTVGAFAYYRFKAFRTQMRIQLNVRGLNNDNRLHPYTVLDRGNGEPIVARYSLGSGRSFALQLTADY